MVQAQKIIELIEIGTKDGFLSIDCILNLGLSLIDFDRVCENILEKGIKIIDKDIDKRENKDVRSVDELGRVVIPKVYRDRFNYQNGHELEIYIDNNMIRLINHEQKCVLCGNKTGANKTVFFKGKIVCEVCLNNLKLL